MPSVLSYTNAFPGIPAPQHLAGQSSVTNYQYPGAVQPKSTTPTVLTFAEAFPDLREACAKRGVLPKEESPAKRDLVPELELLTRKQLADRIGYCVSAIQNFENGYNNVTKAPINPNDMTRFRLCCASIAGRVDFDWGPASDRLIARAVELKEKLGGK